MGFWICLGGRKQALTKNKLTSPNQFLEAREPLRRWVLKPEENCPNPWLTVTPQRHRRQLQFQIHKRKNSSSPQKLLQILWFKISNGFLQHWNRLYPYISFPLPSLLHAFFKLFPWFDSKGISFQPLLHSSQCFPLQTSQYGFFLSSSKIPRISVCKDCRKIHYPNRNKCENDRRLHQQAGGTWSYATGKAGIRLPCKVKMNYTKTIQNKRFQEWRVERKTFLLKLSNLRHNVL